MNVVLVSSLPLVLPSATNVHWGITRVANETLFVPNVLLVLRLYLQQARESSIVEVSQFVDSQY